MVPLTSLWIPIVVSAVVVFLASSVLHMLFTYHRKEFRRLPDEEKLMDAMRQAGITPGNYNFPWSQSAKEMGSPEMIDKFKAGPVGILTVIPSGPPAMGKYLVQWFLFCLFVGVVVAYLTGRTLTAEANYLAVFRVAGTVAFLSHASAHIPSGIWKGQGWSLTIKEVFDGLIYGLLTAGVFGWLWPR